MIHFPPTPYSWHINESLLADSINERVMDTVIEVFFNKLHPQDIYYPLWTTHKAIIQGHPNKIATAQNKEN